jgi:hypothetical protein
MAEPAAGVGEVAPNGGRHTVACFVEATRGHDCICGLTNWLNERRQLWASRSGTQVDDHDGHTVNIGPVHVGKHEWKNGAEMEWECADNCPHPSHDDEGSQYAAYKPLVLRREAPPQGRPPVQQLHLGRRGRSRRVHRGQGVSDVAGSIDDPRFGAAVQMLGRTGAFLFLMYLAVILFGVKAFMKEDGVPVE